MKLTLKNIGKIGAACVEICGITVIAGVNDTGKSTVGRALFSMFNGFYQIEDQIKRERIDSIEQQIAIMMFACGLHSLRAKSIYEIAEDISHIEQNETALLKIRKEILDFAHSYENTKGFSLEESHINTAVSRIQEILKVTDKTIEEACLSKRLRTEFSEQICNIFFGGTGELQLQIKGKTIVVRIQNQEVSEIQNADDLVIYTEAIYIDNPFALHQRDCSGHQAHLKSKIFPEKQQGTLIEGILVKEKLKTIYDKISFICGGSIVRNEQGNFEYKKQNSDKLLHMQNLSAGLKTFAILKTLLLNGAIEQGGTVILDEPEIHLHPEWQLAFAELIVLIQKEFKLHVLINTHSPYFLRAIQVYSAKYETVDSCKYYLSESAGDQAVIHDVTDNIEAIYEKLSRPLQELEDGRWQDG